MLLINRSNGYVVEEIPAFPELLIVYNIVTVNNIAVDIVESFFIFFS